MAPKSSSASSATRKKHAAKKAQLNPTQSVSGTPSTSTQSKQKKDKKDKKAPKLKQFIPPPTYTGEVDPVDRFKLGLHDSPVKAERVVILRKLGKKDPVTVERGLDECLTWINTTYSNSIPSDHPPFIIYDELLATLPVLIHHLPRLVIHPSRRVRLLVLTLLDTLINLRSDQDHPCRSTLLNPVELERPDYVGSWFIPLWDPDKSIRSIAIKVWDQLVDLNVEGPDQVHGKIKLTNYDSEILQHITHLIQRSSDPGEGPQEPTISLTVPRKVAELSESFESTSCRLRASAFEALAHLLLIHPTPASTFDSIIHSSIAQLETWESILPVKNQEPRVRKAMWSFIKTLSTREACRPLLDALLPTCSSLVLNAAFTERDFGVQGTMLIGLVALLKAYHSLWWSTKQTALPQPINPIEDLDTTRSVSSEDSFEPPSILTTFYAFLELGCPSNPTLLYPALILIVSSFPITIDNIENFFSHLWAAHDGRPLRSNRPRGLIELYNAWSECLLFFAQKVEDEHAAKMLQSQISEAWRLLGDFGERADTSFDALVSGLIKVFHRSSLAFDCAWPVIENCVKKELDPKKLLRYLQFLSKGRLLHPQEPLGIKAKQVAALTYDRVFTHVNTLSDTNQQTDWIPVLTAILKDECTEAQLLSEASQLALLEFCQNHLSKALWNGSKSHYNLFLEVIQCKINRIASGAWLAVMNLNDFDAEITDINQPIISGILSYIVKPNHRLQLPNLEIDQFVLRCLEQFLEGDTNLHVLIEPILTCPQLFIKDETIVSMMCITARALHDAMKNLPQLPHSLDQVKLHAILSGCCLQLLHLDQVTPTSRLSLSSTLKQVVLDLFAAESFLPLITDEPVVGLVQLAHSGQSLATELYPSDQMSDLHRAILQLLVDCLTDIDCRVHPFDLMEIFRGFLEQCPELKAIDFLHLLPIGTASSNALTFLFHPRQFSNLIAMVDSLAQPTFSGEHELGISLRINYDRVTLGILDLFIQDRQLTLNYLWLWEHCMYIGELARYSKSTSSSLNQADHLLTRDELSAIVSAVDSNTTYLVSSLASQVTPAWHIDIIMKLNQPEDHLSNETDPLKMLILNLAIRSRVQSTQGLAALSLHRVLASLFKYSDTSTNDFENWLTFAQQIQSSNIHLCLPLIRSLKSYLFVNENFQKYQNRLAARLTDVPSSKANLHGLHLILVLCATAPSPDSVHVFLPQQRSIFLLQAIGEWLKSDDELENEVIAKLLELFSNLAPIVQTVMGSHWHQMVDLIAVNLEEGSWEDEESLLLVWQSCLLIKTIQGILRHNHDLQNEIGSQIQGCLKSVLDLFCSAPFRCPMCETKVTLLNAMEDVLKDEKAQSLYAQAPIPLLVNSLYSSSIRTSVLGLSIAQTAVKNFIDDLAVEIELNAETAPSPSLPKELLDSVQMYPDDSQTGSLLGWTLIFSYIQNASSRLRNSYSTQLRDTNLVSDNLIPLLHELLQVAERGKPIDISIWDIPSFNFLLMEDCNHKPIPLAAYVYFLALQAVPSQMRSWWEGCRNKQLSMSVGGFISRHFSPILISQELGRFKEPGILKSLTDENMTIKVSPVIKEVKVTYTVDEESMEIVIRIPSDYPLQPVEVLDIRKVGIPDTTWRAWILVVQQSIVNLNGSIADAIGLFKKNISLHFDGVEACAICYAIISVVDRSLPSKACRTCRNRFHPSCLYKWFSTSHGSSCPLCRSLF